MSLKEEHSDVSSDEAFDILIIGGGINGAGIARDAVGRGYRVGLCEAGDFASGTSSASTKLIHGGLRYLEYLEFRLVREALRERDILLKSMPHISWPMRFVLPLHEGMVFEGHSPISKLLGLLMPWRKNGRPGWTIRAGLFLYDFLAGKTLLPKTRTLNLRRDASGISLKEHFVKGFEYSDGWVDDARLVIANLRDAADKGAEILPRTQVVSARYKNDLWQVDLKDRLSGDMRQVSARMLVNATGPWIDEVLRNVFGKNAPRNIRLVRGSHIVVAKKFDHDRAYFFQNSDGRVLFAIPYEGDFTLIGTTDADHEDMHEKPSISADEIEYLCEKASAYFREPVTKDDILWTYSGVRGLFDDGASKAQDATRDYVLRWDNELGDNNLLNIFGGKITTFRKLSEAAMRFVEERLGTRGNPWTGSAILPGGDLTELSFEEFVAQVAQNYPFLPKSEIFALCRRHGSNISQILGSASSLDDLGEAFGAGLYAAEVRTMVASEWARSGEDVLYRRSKLGLKVSAEDRQRVDDFVQKCLADC